MGWVNGWVEYSLLTLDLSLLAQLGDAIGPLSPLLLHPLSHLSSLGGGGNGVVGRGGGCLGRWGVGGGGGG